LADGLSKLCGNTNMWCRGAALGVSFLESMFSRSTVTGSYKNIQDRTVTETWSEESVIWRPWLTSYL
jgi:hypothetical protein